MKSTRRQRSDSARAAVAATQAAALGPLPPPAHIRLREGDLPYWNEIVQSRQRSSWTGVDLAQAGVMARAQADIERLQREVEDEGETITAANGCPIINPKAKLLETLSKRVTSLSRALHVHALATSGRPEDAAKNAELERQARQDADDDLIPRLRAV